MIGTLVIIEKMDYPRANRNDFRRIDLQKGKD